MASAPDEHYAAEGGKVPAKGDRSIDDKRTGGMTAVAVINFAKFFKALFEHFAFLWRQIAPALPALSELLLLLRREILPALEVLADDRLLCRRQLSPGFKPFVQFGFFFGGESLPSLVPLPEFLLLLWAHLPPAFKRAGRGLVPGLGPYRRGG